MLPYVISVPPLTISLVTIYICFLTVEVHLPTKIQEISQEISGPQLSNRRVCLGGPEIHLKASKTS